MLKSLFDKSFAAKHLEKLGREILLVWVLYVF